MSKRKIHVSQIPEPFTQDNFKTIGMLFQTIPFLKGEWKFLELSINGSGSSIKIPHNLQFAPLDVILLSSIGGTVSFNYNEFDKTNISLNATVTSSPMTIRIFLGRYSEDSVNV